MKLVELQPRFIRYESRIKTYEVVIGDPSKWQPGDPTRQVTGPREYKIFVPTLLKAQGIVFLCPKCFVPQGVGTHLVEVSFAQRGLVDEVGTHNNKGQPVRWEVSGNDYTDLTTTPSVLIEGGCAWHGYITKGTILGC